MSADNLKIIGNSMGIWKKNISAAKNARADKTPYENRKNTARMDTFEIRNYDAPVPPAQEQTATSNAIKEEKANIIKELSQSHVDVNRFLEIKAQVRAGKYEIDAKDIASSLMPYVDFD